MPRFRAIAQPDAAPIIAAQKRRWRRSPAWTACGAAPPGRSTRAGRHNVVHTERVGLSSAARSRSWREGRYLEDGSVGFNAFGIISFDPASRAYTLHSYAMGHKGDFPLTILPDGYVWEVPAGPGAKIRYTATIGGGKWREVGDRIVGDAAPMRMFEMNLTRVGDSNWPESIRCRCADKKGAAKTPPLI